MDASLRRAASVGATLRLRFPERSTERRTSTLYPMVSAIHETLLRATDESAVMQSACDLAVRRGGFRMAWIGLVDPTGTVIVPRASAGVVDGYLDGIVVTAGDEPSGRGPTGRAFRSGHHVVCSDIATDLCMAPWREKALARGFRSSAAFPLTVEGKTLGAFTVYAPDRRHFGRLEVAAVDELTHDLAFSINSLHIAEKKRVAEQALAASEASLRTLNAELERRVAARTAALEASNREIEAFAYSVSHDLRAPLRAMTGFAQLLSQKHGASLDGEAKQYLERISANAAKMNELIDELLRLSRLGSAEMKVTSVDPTDVAAGVIEDLFAEARDAGVKMILHPLPECLADRGLLQHVYANLLSNAIKFSAGRPSAQVTVGAHREGDETVYDVTDNGVGFDMQYADKLFRVFQRLHSEPRFQGTGVGLALVQRIIHRHGGRVWAEAEVDRGAGFHFTLGTHTA